MVWNPKKNDSVSFQKHVCGHIKVKLFGPVLILVPRANMQIIWNNIHVI